MAPAVVKSAQRSFEIFELFDRERRPLPLKTICARLGYAASSGSALMKSLVALGYLDYDRDQRTYFPTMRIAILGRWVEGAMFGEGHILRLMEDLRDATGQAILLATQSDIYAQYVHVLADEPMRFGAPPGTLRPLAGSSVGLMLRADGEIEKLCRRINFEAKPANRISVETVLRTVRQAREEGYVFAKNAAMAGGSVLAMLLPRGPFGKRFAIGVGGATTALEDKLELILRESRQRIGRLNALMAQQAGA
ncbi:MAG: IclR family transcriptional regulator [Hyphomonadaceae bacterium]